MDGWKGGSEEEHSAQAVEATRKCRRVALRKLWSHLWAFIELLQGVLRLVLVCSAL